MEIQGQRYLSPELRRFLNEETKMAFVAGPGQAGKTTLARRLLTETGTDGLYFNWDIEAHRKLLIRQPGDFWQGGAITTLAAGTSELGYTRR